MKHCSTLVFLLFSLVGYAQEPFFQPLTQWDAPEISENRLQNANVSSFRVETYERKSLRSRPVATVETVSYLKEDGSPLRIVETRHGGSDTALITTYKYNGNGTLWRKVIDDRILDRRYRSGYRCTRDQEFYQVRSYELLNEQDRMLLSARQYIYRDGQLQAIQLRENDRVVKVHRFTYNEKGAVIEERLEDGEEKMLTSVSYTYGTDQLITEVKNRDLHGNTSRYLYSYNEQGLPKQVEWYEGDSEDPKGLALYEYDQRGLLKAFNRVMYPKTPRQLSTIKRYTYEILPKEEGDQAESGPMIATH